MSQITGGKVTFRRNVQPAQYEGREAIVEIGFAVDEGASEAQAQAMLDKASTMAKAKVVELVHSDKVEASKPTTSAGAGKAGQAMKEAAAQNMAAADAKAAKDAKAAAPADELEDTPQISQNPEDRKDPAQEVDPDLPGDTLELSEGQAVKDYSDKDLTDTVSRVNAKIKNPAKIKEVRAKYTENPTASVTTIPKDKRAAFIKELEALAK